MPDKDQIISDFLEATKPRERQCRICGETYVGMRDICEDPACYWAMQARIEYNRSLRPRDYVSTARKTFLVTDLPEPPKPPPSRWERLRRLFKGSKGRP